MLWLKQVINISDTSIVLLGLFLLILKPVLRKIESTPALLNQVIVILSLTVITLVIFPNVLYILYISALIIKVVMAGAGGRFEENAC